MSFNANAGGVTPFKWSARWAGDDRLWRWARDLKVSGGVAKADGAGGWSISSPPGAQLHVRYRIVSAFDHDPTVDDDVRQSYPIIRPNWFYVVGETLFGSPNGDAAAPATFVWSGGRSGLTFASDLQHLSTPTKRGVRPGTVADIQESIAFGGADVRVFGDLHGSSRVRVAIRGKYKFSPEAFDTMARRMIDTERRFWGGSLKDPFLVTAAPLAGVPGSSSFSGTGRTDAFAIWYDSDAPLSEAVAGLAHEYFHTWNSRQLGGLKEGADQESLSYWFSEGFTDYYARRMALASGLWSLQDFADSWNKILKEYDLSPVQDAPNAQIVGGFWANPDFGQLPYRRGAVLAAELDAQLRKSDVNSPGLDAILRRQRTNAAMQRENVSSDASSLFRQTLHSVHPELDRQIESEVERGVPIVLADDAFAPCFRVTSSQIAAFDRGFDIAATMKNGNRVVGLEAGGPADRAGLKDGDHIRIDESAVPDPNIPRVYIVREPGGGTHEIRYLPVGSTRRVQQLVVNSSLDAAAIQMCLRLFGSRAPGAISSHDVSDGR